MAVFTPEAVAPALQPYVVAPPAVNVAEVHKQMDGELTVTIGIVFEVMVT